MKSILLAIALVATINATTVKDEKITQPLMIENFGCSIIDAPLCFLDTVHYPEYSIYIMNWKLNFESLDTEQEIVEDVIRELLIKTLGSFNAQAKDLYKYRNDLSNLLEINSEKPNLIIGMTANYSGNSYSGFSRYDKNENSIITKVEKSSQPPIDLLLSPCREALALDISNESILDELCKF